MILLKGGWSDIWFFQLRRLRESTGGDLSKKEMHTCPSKFAWSAVLKALPLSGDMTSELHRENCRFAFDIPEHSEYFLGAQSVAGRRQPSNKCVVAVETKEYSKINLRVHCGGIFSEQKIAICITPRGLPAFAGDFAKGRLVRNLGFSVASLV